MDQETDEQGNTALHLAAQGDHVEICKRLMKLSLKGISVDRVR